MAPYKISFFGCDLSVETITAIGEKACQSGYFVSIQWLGVVLSISKCNVLCCWIEPISLRVKRDGNIYVFSLLDESA